MKRPKFTAGAKRPQTINLDIDLDKNLFGGTKAKKIKQRFGQVNESEGSKQKSLYVRGMPSDLIEKLKNIVFHEKVNGDPSSSQSKLITKALAQFVAQYPFEVEERPDWVKQIENKKRNINK